MRPLIGLVALLPLLAAAETAYVTDNLRLRLYNDADLTSVADTLVSGDEFEVLSRNAQTALVELPDGRQGYVSAAYIVYEKPAKLIVSESQAEQDRLSAELEELKASFAEPAALVERLNQEAADLAGQLDTANTRAADLEADNASLRKRQERYSHSLPYTWVGGAIVICLVAGFIGGLWWTDMQNRRRHGGIRVY